MQSESMAGRGGVGVGLLPGSPAHKEGPAGETICSLQCLENPAEFSHKSSVCHIQIWIGLIKKPYISQTSALPASWLDGACNPGTVCQESLNATPGICLELTVFWKRHSSTPQSFHAQLGSEGV